MRWDAFEEACPAISAIARERFEADQVVLLGTIRADGSPRISPNELDLVDGRLYLGMMPGSRKVQDLRRDPRLLLHSVPIGRTNPGGDIKLRGRAIQELDQDLREAYRRAIHARIGWAPEEEDFPLFSMDIEDASFIRFGEDRVVLRWNKVDGFRRLQHPDDP